jgi:hypothetical protein
MRGWVCRLQLLLAVSSAVILGSESRGTRDHILMSPTRDSPKPGGPGPCIYIPRQQDDPVIPPFTGFPFRRLLILAKLRWRIRLRLHTGCSCFGQSLCLVTSNSRLSFVLPNTSYNYFARIPRKTWSSIIHNECLVARYLTTDVLLLFRARVVGICLPTRCLTMGIHVTIFTRRRLWDWLQPFIM